MRIGLWLPGAFLKALDPVHYYSTFLSETFRGNVHHLFSSLPMTPHLLLLQPSLSVVAENLMVVIEAVKKFCDSHDLKINSQKTQLILFKKPGKTIPEDFHLTLDNVIIKPEKTVKLLCVTLDQHLTFGPHIDSVVNKCQGLLGILAKAIIYLKTY